MSNAATLIILTALMMPIDAVAASPASEVTAVQAADAVTNLVVDVDASVPNANTVHRRVEASAREALARAKAPRTAEDRVLVHVTGEQYEYSVRVAAVRGDVTLEERTDSCECNTSELSERVSTEVTRVAARFTQMTDEPSPAPSVEQVTPPTAMEPTKPVEPKAQLREPVLLPAEPQPSTRVSAMPEPRGRTSEPAIVPHDARRMRIAGIATLITGSALLLVGAGMMAAGSTELLNRWRHYERDWRPLGFTLGGVGFAGVGIGGSLMLFEEIRCRRRPDSCASNRRYAKRIDPSLAKRASPWARTK